MQSNAMYNIHAYGMTIIVATKITATKCSPRTLWQLSATSFCAAVIFVRSIIVKQSSRKI